MSGWVRLLSERHQAGGHKRWWEPTPAPGTQLVWGVPQGKGGLCFCSSSAGGTSGLCGTISLQGGGVGGPEGRGTPSPGG